MMLNRAALVKQAFCAQIGRVRLFGCGKFTQIMSFAANSYSGGKAFPLHFNTKKAAGVSGIGSALVFNVLVMRDIAQIFPAVVIRLAVDVIHSVCGPISSHIQKSQPLRVMASSINTNFYVAQLCFAGGSLPDRDVVAGSSYACEVTRRRVIVEDLSKSLSGKIGPAHAVVPFKRWSVKWPDSVEAPSGRAYFSGAF